MTLELNRPILVFYGNLLYHGITLRVVDGQLRVGGDTAKLSPAYRDEIRRRAEQLTELLSPEVPEPLAPYFGRLLRVDETLPALGAAEQLDVDVRMTPVNGGWLMTMGDGSALPSTRRQARQDKRRQEAETQSFAPRTTAMRPTPRKAAKTTP